MTTTNAIVIDANVAAIITALALLVTAVTGLIVALQTKKGLGQIHTLVNSHASDQAQRIAQLGAALQSAGIQIPVLAPATVTGIAPSKYPAPNVDPNAPLSGEAMELTGTVTGIVEPTKK